MSPNGSSLHCSNTLQVWQIAYNKRINTRCARWGQKHVGSLRFARYYSLRIFARYAGVIRHGVFSFCNLSRYITESALIQLFSHLAFRRNHQTHFATGSFAQEKARTQQNGLILVALKN